MKVQSRAAPVAHARVGLPHGPQAPAQTMIGKPCARPSTTGPEDAGENRSESGRHGAAVVSVIDFTFVDQDAPAMPSNEMQRTKPAQSDGAPSSAAKFYGHEERT